MLDGRKAVHMGVGLIIIVAHAFLPLSTVISAGVFALFFLLFIIFLRLNNIKTPLDSLIDSLGEKDRFPAEGAFWYLVGSLLILLLITSAENRFFAFVFLAFGDALAATIGKHGVIPLPWNPKKTLEGLSAFIGVALILCVFFPHRASSIFFLGLFSGLAESLSDALNDNLLIPLCACIFFSL